jgi:parallel beta-helix repeat protein
MSTPTRPKRGLACLAALALLATACGDQAPPLDPAGTYPLTSADNQQAVQVAPPAGIYEQDRASIVAALARVRPGGTVHFAHGTYLIGNDLPDSFDWIRVAVPGITLQGHPDGTTLKGCEPVQGMVTWGGCMGIQLIGGHQTVRGFTFEHFNQGLVPGFFLFREPAQHGIGGYVIENNTFRSSIWGVRLFGQWEEPAVVRNNTFVNVGLAVQMWGRTVHVTDNEMSAPDWTQIPNWFYAGDGVGFYAADRLESGPCDDNVAERNRIEQHWGGVTLYAEGSTSACRHNVIRDNTFLETREIEPFPGGAIWFENVTPSSDRISHNRIEGNVIRGSQGVGMFVYRSTDNRFGGNTVEAVTQSQFVPTWLGEGNGSGIWISPASSGNEIHGTLFDDVRMYDVVFEGHMNTFATVRESDILYDLGTGNILTGPGNRVRNLPTPNLLGAPAATPRIHLRGRMGSGAFEP